METMLTIASVLTLLTSIGVIAVLRLAKQTETKLAINIVSITMAASAIVIHLWSYHTKHDVATSIMISRLLVNISLIAIHWMMYKQESSN